MRILHLRTNIAVVVLALAAVTSPGAQQVTFERILRRRARAAELVVVLRQCLQSSPQRADRDHARQRRRPRAEVGVAEPFAREVRGDRAGRRRCPVHASRARRFRAPIRWWRSTRSPDVRSGRWSTSPRPTRVRVAGVSAAVSRFSATRCTWAPSTRGSSPSMPRPERSCGTSKPAPLGQKNTEKYAITHAPLVVKDKIILGMGGGDFGVLGFIARLRCEEREGAVALLHDSTPWRAGQRDVGRRLLEDRRRRRVEQRRLRSRGEPRVLRHRQSGAGLGRTNPPGRQPLQR